jgi:hypothetical protein
MSLLQWCRLVALVAMTYFMLVGAGVFTLWFWLQIF